MFFLRSSLCVPQDLLESNQADLSVLMVLPCSQLLGLHADMMFRSTISLFTICQTTAAGSASA